MEKENKIINWNNNLADLPFRNLTANEMDIFLAVCCECQKQKNNLVRIEFSKLGRLSNFNACGKQRFGAYIESVFKKLLRLYFVYKDDKHYDCFILFTRFRVDYENDFVEVSVNEPFMYLLNNLRLSYTSIVE